MAEGASLLMLLWMANIKMTQNRPWVHQHIHVELPVCIDLEHMISDSHVDDRVLRFQL